MRPSIMTVDLLSSMIYIFGGGLFFKVYTHLDLFYLPGEVNLLSWYSGLLYTFWSGFFTFLRIIENPRDLCLYGLYLSIFTMLETKKRLIIY